MKLDLAVGFLLNAGMFGKAENLAKQLGDAPKTKP